MYQKRPLTLTTISRELVSDTIQSLQTLSDRTLIPDTIPSTERATIHLTTQLQQSRYEYTIAREEMETDALFYFTFPSTQPQEKCRKCAAVGEERLYD
jgi:hypothetical protein